MHTCTSVSVFYFLFLTHRWEYDPEIYANTRAFVLSKDNPTFVPAEWQQQQQHHHHHHHHHHWLLLEQQHGTSTSTSIS